MLELIVKGLILWVYDMILECVGFIGNLLLEVFSMDIGSPQKGPCALYIL